MNTFIEKVPAAVNNKKIYWVVYYNGATAKRENFAVATKSAAVAFAIKKKETSIHWYSLPVDHRNH